ncbi:hypothetical protein B566_EDAN010764 [Ephemera danica]|nr:hypothetical protein B566_EDAN010764 [Ephemera danica]
MHTPYGSQYKPPLLVKPLISPVKKTLLQHPSEALLKKKQPLLGATPVQHLLKTPWLASKRQFPSDDFNLAPTTNATYLSSSNKRQALLPTPGDWSYPKKKQEIETNSTPVSSGLLPRPYHTPPQSGLLPAPTTRGIYVSPRPLSPLKPPEKNKNPHLVSAPPVPVTSAPVLSGLLPLPGSRMQESGRNVETRSPTFKKAPLLQTPSEQGIIYSNNNNKKPLLPIARMMVSVQEQSTKPPLLQAPHPAISNRANHKNERIVGSGQPLLREPLILTPPILPNRLPDSPTHHHKKNSPVYHSLDSNPPCGKRPLLPTPSLF